MTRQLNRRAVTALALLVTALSVLVATAAADEPTDRLKARAQKALTYPGIASPYPCDDGWVASSSDNLVVDVTPWMSAAGLKPGDRFVAIAGVTVAKGGWPRALQRAPAGQLLQVVVERGRQRVELLLSCRRNADWSRGYRAAFEAIVAGQWDQCLKHAKKLAAIAGRPFSAHLRFQLECHRERARELRQRPPDEYWTLLHTFGAKIVEESRHRPAGVAAVRTPVTAIADALDKAGRGKLAEELRRDLGDPATTARPKPEDSANAGVRAGTAFAVRPDGVFVTALHVVRDAKRVEIWCHDSGRARATVVRTSEGADLAVLKLERGETPVHLSFADPRAVKIGERVFTVGFPASNMLGPDMKFTDGVVSALSGAVGDSRHFQITVPLHPGNSGGPLVNEAGEVVGVVISTAAARAFLKGTGTLPQNVNWAVKGSLAISLLEPGEPQPPTQDRSAAIERATKATCQVRASPFAQD